MAEIYLEKYCMIIVDFYGFVSTDAAADAGMGQCALSPRNKPTHIADLDQILFKEAKKDLTLAQKLCLGKTVYLEVKMLSVCLSVYLAVYLSVCLSK